MTNYEARHETDGEGGMWLVRLPNGGVRAVTLEQLDEAYQRDLISADTEVLEDGATEWRKLGDLINDEDLTPAYPTAVYNVHRDAQGMTGYSISGQAGPESASATDALSAYLPPQRAPAYQAPAQTASRNPTSVHATNRSAPIYPSDVPATTTHPADRAPSYPQARTAAYPLDAPVQRAVPTPSSVDQGAAGNQVVSRGYSPLLAPPV
ncbi:MAG TPA: hypothetical protein VKP30_19735, partial [Polyangiaceae bacterium]|nr:hypothetical protein [Polyangiaceae bacterium]